MICTNSNMNLSMADIHILRLSIHSSLNLDTVIKKNQENSVLDNSAMWFGYCYGIDLSGFLWLEHFWKHLG